MCIRDRDYNNKELVEYSKREKANKCNHCSSQVISEIPYQIEIDLSLIHILNCFGLSVAEVSIDKEGMSPYVDVVLAPY